MSLDESVKGSGMKANSNWSTLEGEASKHLASTYLITPSHQPLYIAASNRNEYWGKGSNCVKRKEGCHNLVLLLLNVKKN
ncbi:hypothetical protein C0J52_10820 [Blattella germanica]|nr:hypothetical protein C0J52_10820 [Blattella germanica]